MNIGLALGIPFQSKIKKVLGKDSFNRVDNGSTLGNSETGQPWLVSLNPWGVINNKAYATGSSTEYAYFDTGKSNVEITLKITFSQSEGIAFRFTDAINNLFVRIASGELSLYKIVAGTSTKMATYPFATNVGQEYTLKIICINNSIKVYLNGILVLSPNESFNQNATKHGVRSSGTSGRFDDFIVMEV